MFLKSIEIENFKCFGERVTIPLAPITLIYGENSAGKSSILQLLYMLKQTVDYAPRGVALVPSHRYGLVNLGGYYDFSHDHKMGDLRVRLGFQESPGHGWSLAALLRKQAFDEASCEDADIDCVIRGRKPKLQAWERSFSIEAVFKHGAQTNRTTLAQLDLAGGSPEPSSVRFVRRAPHKGDEASLGECVCPAGRECTKEVYENFRKQRPRIIRTLDLMRDYGIAAPELDELRAFYSHEFSFEDFRQRNEANPFYYAIEPDSFIPKAMPVILPADDRVYLLSCLSEEHQCAFHFESGDLQDLEPDTGRGFVHAMVIPVRWGTDRLDVRSELVKDTAKERGQPDDLVNLGASYLGERVSSFLGGLAPIAPFRTPPERWHILSGGASHSVGHSGEYALEILHNNPRLCGDFNKWLRRLTDYECEVRPIGPAMPDGVVLWFYDTRREERVPVTPADVGYGLSQIIPMIVECMAPGSQCITIEQPEVHIHPRLQAELGDLLAEYAETAARQQTIQSGKQFIVETHSEHLMLRIQKLIRKKKLKPEDVSVLYVSRLQDGSNVQPLWLNKQGEFVDPWPGGFFPERRNEIFGS